MSFSPNLGRWLQQDPIGFIAGDDNLYRFVDNEPIYGIDPLGEKVSKAPNRDTTQLYYDELFRQEFEGAPGNKELADFVKNLQSLKSIPCLKVQTFYISGEDQPAQFAKEAPKKPCTINYFFGHGELLVANRGKANQRIYVDPESLKSIKNSLNAIQPANPACKAPKYEIYACYAETYHNAIPKANQVDKPFVAKAGIEPDDIAEHFNKNFDSIKAMIQRVCECCKPNKVEFNLYFGAAGGKTEAQQVNKPTQWLYENWGR